MAISRLYFTRVLVVLAIIVLIIDRLSFALISQWREDQGTNIYLGLHFFEWKTPVGLISSIGVPNPNGMVVIGALLALLPGLIAVSTMLGILQVTAICAWLYSARIPKQSYWITVAFPILSSLVLRADGAEFWNNVIYITFNVFYLFLLNLILKYKKPVFFTMAVMMVLFAPSMYLAGASNAAAFAFLLLLQIYWMQKDLSTRMEKFQSIDWLTLLIAVSFIIYVVWFPYFMSVPLESIRGTSHESMWGRLEESFQVLYSIPIWLFRFTNIRLPVFYDSHNQALSWLIVNLAYLAALILKIQFIGFVILAALSTRKEGLKNQFRINNFRYLSPFLLIGLVYFFTAILGGPHLHEGERAEMTHQLYPMFLFIVFTGSYFYSQKFGNAAKRVSAFGAVSYGVVSMVCGALFFWNVYHYSSPVLDMPDVPAKDKVAAVQFIANDWKATNPSQLVEVDYDLAGPWTWIPEFGKNMLPYYPPVFTVGRALDYEFERVYGLKNYQEGIQERSVDTARYVITYADACKNLPLENLNIYYFGSICVQKKRN